MPPPPLAAAVTRPSAPTVIFEFVYVPGVTVVAGTDAACPDMEIGQVPEVPVPVSGAPPRLDSAADAVVEFVPPCAIGTSQRLAEELSVPIASHATPSHTLNTYGVVVVLSHICPRIGETGATAPLLSPIKPLMSAAAAAKLARKGPDCKAELTAGIAVLIVDPPACARTAVSARVSKDKSRIIIAP